MQPKTFEQRLEEYVSGTGGGISGAHGRAVRKFCLPIGERGTLLGLLSKLDIDRAHLMSSFDGVVTELKARRERQAERDITR